jgi:hypothetical protein
LLVLSAALAGPALAPSSTGVTGVTSLRFDAEILADLGVALSDVNTSSAPLRDGALAFALDPPSSSVVLDAAGDDFEGFVAAELRHAGGLALHVHGTRVDLAGFRLMAAAPPHALELRDAHGTLWLLVDKPHGVLTPPSLKLSDADLLIAPELAALLGRPDLAGTYIGVFDSQLTVPPTSAARSGAGLAGGGGCVGDFTQPVDLVMFDITGMTQAVREPGGRVAMAPGATVLNQGPGDVRWNRAIAPSTPVGPHPFLSLHFYRLSGGVLEQIGRADLKHTFFATNEGCGCPGGHILYAGCFDFYGISTNLDRFNLGPRDEIDALTLAWSSLGSHFDGVPVDDVRNHSGDSQHDNFQHRLVVMEPDLQTPGARYFYDGWYMAPNDSDLENSMGHREVDPNLAGSTWSFPTVDSGTQTGSILDVFVDPGNVQPGEATELHDTGEGRVQLAAVASDLGAGQHHYEYALMNFDFERRVRSFTVSLDPGQAASNVDFGDGDASAANDWTASVSDAGVTWTAPAGQELDWGTLFNFRLDVDAPPLETRALLMPQAPGATDAVAVRTVPEPGAGASLAASAALLAWLSRGRSRRTVN